MSTKDSRSGGKYCGSHTTIIPAAAIVCDIAHALKAVSKITLGFIKAGLRPTGGQRRVKIIDRDGSIFLSVRDNATNQEIFIYSTDVHSTKLAIAKGARDNGLHICFGDLSKELKTI